MKLTQDQKNARRIAAMQGYRHLKATVKDCPACGAEVWSGYDEDQMALHVTVDPPIGKAGDRSVLLRAGVALLQGRHVVTAELASTRLWRIDKYTLHAGLHGRIALQHQCPMKGRRP